MDTFGQMSFKCENRVHVLETEFTNIEGREVCEFEGVWGRKPCVYSMLSELDFGDFGE